MGGASSAITISYAMIFRLTPHAIEAGYRIMSFDRVDSTNILATAFARSGDTGKLWIVAIEQMAGRGRRGRHWVNIPNNLYATLLLIDDFSSEQTATLGFVAGVSLIDALQHILSRTDRVSYSLKLKWPNDIFLNGGKLGGILLEYLPFLKGGNGIVIGIGVNVVTSPIIDLPYPATSLWQAGVYCSAAEIFEVLSHTWVDNYNIWNHGAGLLKIQKRWLHHAANLGQMVHVRINNRITSGIFETIDKDCHFVLRRSDGQKVIISAGDVYFGSIASAHL
ncbi:MAG: biotin operon repressor / biotin-[acetyl-CoA-carboxylase] ligase [Candidatus Tokpelaia sp. JSC085]|nr:MAG: biotin operon repressor / biotin-[acetyl-CoA-carboxylase] ligase [Candidatus Tokpelaia sp. JSC085]